MPHPSNRNERRRYARNVLGLSPQEADRIRDLSAVKADAEIRRIEHRLARRQRRSPEHLSPEEAARLENIRLVRRQRRREKLPISKPNGPTETYQIPASQAERRAQFARWTGRRNFPDWALAEIMAYNQQQGEGMLDSYGFRRFWWQYVKKSQETEAMLRASRSDTERVRTGRK